MRSFQDGNGDGDLSGLAAWVDHLAGLGLRAVWITPFPLSPMADFGHDVADSSDADPVGFLDIACLKDDARRFPSMRNPRSPIRLCRSGPNAASAGSGRRYR